MKDNLLEPWPLWKSIAHFKLLLQQMRDPMPKPEVTTFEQYSNTAGTSAVYPYRGATGGRMYAALGLCGEAGEVAELVKKMARDDGGVVNPDRAYRILHELGDVLWYIDAVASEFGWTLQDVAKANVAKLVTRVEKGTLQGEGSER